MRSVLSMNWQIIVAALVLLVVVIAVAMWRDQSDDEGFRGGGHRGGGHGHRGRGGHRGWGRGRGWRGGWGWRPNYWFGAAPAVNFGPDYCSRCWACAELDPYGQTALCAACLRNCL
jgi:hypothetical protein